MRIHFERTGGFAGLRLATTVESDKLPEDEARALKEEVETACFFDLPSKSQQPGGVDRFQYQISVETAGKRHTIEVGESAMPDSLRPLVQHLERLMRTRQ